MYQRYILRHPLAQGINGLVIESYIALGTDYLWDAKVSLVGYPVRKVETITTKLNAMNAFIPDANLQINV